MAEEAASEVRPLPIPLLIYIVNEWADAPRMEAHEGTKPYPSLQTLRAVHPDFWNPLPAIDEQALIATANLVHPVFAASSGSQRAQHLNDLIAKAQLTPSFTSKAWSVYEVWHSTRPDWDLLAAATLSLINYLRHEPDTSPLGTCRGDACVDVYIDQSSAGRRQYCSLTCQNRVRTRAYRARKKAERDNAAAQ